MGIDILSALLGPGAARPAKSQATPRQPPPAPDPAAARAEAAAAKQKQTLAEVREKGVYAYAIDAKHQTMRITAAATQGTNVAATESQADPARRDLVAAEVEDKTRKQNMLGVAMRMDAENLAAAAQPAVGLIIDVSI